MWLKHYYQKYMHIVPVMPSFYICELFGIGIFIFYFFNYRLKTQKACFICTFSYLCITVQNTFFQIKIKDYLLILTNLKRKQTTCSF